VVLGGACVWRGHPSAAGSECNRATDQPIVHVRLPGNPFQALPTPDGCWVFVTMLQGDSTAKQGLAVIRRGGGVLDVMRVVEDIGAPAGMTMTHDGRVLVVAAQDRVEFLDVGRLIAGGANPVLGVLREGRPVGAIAATVTANDSLLFVSNEYGEAITVVNLFQTRRGGYTAPVVIGRVAARLPISVVLSPDERLLYATSMMAPPNFGWPLDCLAPASPARVAQGAVLVIDVARAAQGRPDAVLGAVPAGCSPVRLVLSPDGETAYVTARGDNALLAFDTRRLPADTAHALLARVPVGTAPVGVLAIADGRIVVVANSNRSAGDSADRQELSVIDASRLSAGAGARIGSIPAGSFPRELRATADGRTLLLTNFGSRTLEVIDVARVIKRP
jgi:sugar lactone lactonase YvrE